RPAFMRTPPTRPPPGRRAGPSESCGAVRGTSPTRRCSMQAHVRRSTRLTAHPASGCGALSPRTWYHHRSEMSRKVKKTLAMRVLEGQGIPYEVIEFPSDIHDARGVAEYARVPVDHVYKTLVAEADEPGLKPRLVINADDRSLELKQLEEGVGAKKTHM